MITYEIRCSHPIFLTWIGGGFDKFELEWKASRKANQFGSRYAAVMHKKFGKQVIECKYYKMKSGKWIFVETEVR